MKNTLIKDEKKFLLQGIMFYLMGCILVIAIVLFFSKDFTSLETTIKSEAIINLIANENYILEYEYSGEKFSTAHEIMNTNYNVGDKIYIWYNQHTPHKVYFENELNNFIGPIVFIIVIIGMFLLYFIFITLSRINILKKSTYVKAVFVNFDDGRIVCKWQNPENNKTYYFIGKRKKENYKENIKFKDIDVFVNLQKPKDFLIF